MNADLETLLAVGKRIDALENEMEDLKREEEAPRAEGDETGAADIERRKAELAKQVEEEIRSLCELQEDLKAGAVSYARAEMHWYEELFVLMQLRCRALEDWLRNQSEDGASLYDKFRTDKPNSVEVWKTIEPRLSQRERKPMADRIVEEMFGCKVGICLLDNRPNALDSKRKKLADDGDTDELGGVDASIKEAGTRRSYLLRRHRELDKRMRENIRRDAEREVASYINELLNMADFYLDAIKWLRNTRPADAGNGDLTYFDIFLQSRPADEIWVV